MTLASPTRGKDAQRPWRLFVLIASIVSIAQVHGPLIGYKTFANVDEAYAKTVVTPTLGISRNLLWKGIDAGLIDGALVNGSAMFTRFTGWIGSQFQTGRVGTYAWVLLLGVIGVLSAFSFR